MWQLIGVFRLAAMSVVLIIGVILSFFIVIMSQKVFHWILSRWYRILLLLVGVRVKQIGEPSSDSILVVANHISWADILVIGSRLPIAFLAMKEVERWPVIGPLSARAGTLFIERGKGAPKAIDEVTASLRKSNGVVIFPEGRTSDGAVVKRFHPRIFESAIRAGTAVIPVSLIYRDSKTLPFKPSRISFAAAPDFFQSVWKTACGPTIEAELRFFPEIDGIPERQDLSKAAHRTISEYVNLTLGSS